MKTMNQLHLLINHDGKSIGHSITGYINRAIPPVLKSKTAQTLFLFSILVMLPVSVPVLHRYRFYVPANPISIKWPAKADVIQTPQNPSATIEQTTEATTGSAQPTIDTKFEPGTIEDQSGHALDHFFAALEKAESGSSQVRISHYGDSPITNDGITSTVRRQLQLKYGDAGHGFVLFGKPWGWYGHIGVKQSASSDWQSDPMFISRGDHMFGLGGASFTTNKAGASATFSTDDAAPVGHKVSSFDIYFLSQPGGGDFSVEIDSAPSIQVSTASDTVHSDFHKVTTEEGAHTLTIKAVGNGEVRLFGVVFETNKKGIQYDSLGVNGAYVGLLDHYMDADHWTQQLRHRNPELVILNYGTNESQFENLHMDQYEQDTKEVIHRIRQALPDVSIMLVSPMDRGTRGPGGAIVTRPMIPKLVSYQRRIAAETGCAFFDMYSAMGGEGTVAKWYDARPRLMGGDLTHPTWQGSEIVGNLLSGAIINSFEKYKDELSSDARQQATAKLQR